MSDGADPRLAALAPLPAALVVVDVQASFADPALLAAWGVDEAGLASVAAAVTRTAALVDAARAAGVPVVWVELGSDPARPWRASAWLRTGDPDAGPTPDEPCVVGTPGAAWFGVVPEPGETRVVKRGYSGFRDTGLDALLHERGVGWLALAGLTTECCIAATAFDAVQAEWPVVVATDATAAYSTAMHDAAIEQLAANAAVTLSADAIERLWGAR